MAWGQSDVAPVVSSNSKFPEWDNKSRDEVLAEWEGRKTLLATAKEREMEFRKYVVSRAFPNATEGTNTVELNNGYSLKANIKYNYKLADNKIVEATLDKIAKVGNQGSFIVDRLISWSPSFLLTEYHKLQEDQTEESKTILKLVNDMLIIEDAAPSLEIKAPKTSKK